ncbi:hypothetical protein ACVIHH_004499 [Bradyrhizobium sp. USDA 4518]|uniref:hypothetical protein n=1 Tax=unclassified Bradyrhizobium TaxID=2631580 RepID=UPI00209FBB42|nr:MULTISPECIES: hypothetical protein [unclassified Bradyrhizobium]MCP1834943.1 hypothetical protein [Bradyrhizobium sp. USDA 4545]MCP1919688.1 hypothetical protein [Bradyrhizobium sp. USDA 4532]
MTAKAREFLDFWIENSVHAAEQYGTPGASQDVAELARRCIEMAGQQGLTEQDLRDAAGDITDYIRIRRRRRTGRKPIVPNSSGHGLASRPELAAEAAKQQVRFSNVSATDSTCVIARLNARCA